MKPVKMFIAVLTLAFAMGSLGAGEMPEKCKPIKKALEQCAAQRGKEQKKCRRQVRKKFKKDMRACGKHLKAHKKRAKR